MGKQVKVHGRLFRMLDSEPGDEGPGGGGGVERNINHVFGK